MKRPRSPGFSLEEREAQIEGRIVQVMTDLGWEAVSLSQGRATRQTPGVPDLRFYECRGTYRSVWCEVKVDDGKLSPDQARFRERCLNHDELHLTGGLPELEAFLRTGSTDFLPGREFGYTGALAKWRAKEAAKQVRESAHGGRVGEVRTITGVGRCRLERNGRWKLVRP